MKIICFIFLIFIYQNTFSTHFHQKYTPENTILVFDMDDVFVAAHKYSLGAYFLHLIFIKNPLLLWKLTTDSSFRKNIINIYSKTGSDNGGSSYNLARTAQLYPPLQPFFDTILERFHSSRSLVPGVIDLLRTLKSMGYTLMIATNRDRVGFEIIMKHLHFDTLYYGKPLFDRALVTDSTPFIMATTDASGKRFSQKVPQQQYDFFIQTTPYFKPTKDYFENLRSLVDTFAQTSSLFAEKSPHIIFFDDQVKNVMGANQSNTDSASFTVLKSQRALSIKNALAACGIIIPQYESSQQRALPE